MGREGLLVRGRKGLARLISSDRSARYSCLHSQRSIMHMPHALHFSLVAEPRFWDIRKFCESRISRFYPMKVLHGRNANEVLALLRSTERWPTQNVYLRWYPSPSYLYHRCLHCSDILGGFINMRIQNHPVVNLPPSTKKVASVLSECNVVSKTLQGKVLIA